jgi:hypothetical protein
MISTSWLTRDKLFGACATLLLFPIIQQIGTYPIVAVMSGFQERITFQMIRAEIESYRSLPDSVKCTSQISNTIAGWNARIAHEHESNRHVYSDLFSTDRWNAVTLIPLNCP